MTAASFLEVLWAQGFTVSLVGNDRLAVSPASTLHDTQRELLRANKAAILSILSILQSTPEPPEPSEALPSPSNWPELHSAYMAHHWLCPECIGAGQGVQATRRCKAGTALWSDYQPPGHAGRDSKPHAA